ncbi:hypothetical protein GCM10010145_57900 [Streptomyces ruber]|uniref:Integral membrane protein n=2 Tax=Streptomyces TaxID=1883 RepID=A0A918EXY8_9ACTN|nr:streptophobe family protein [Streptomyces ruber]GGQ80562.1 hypothetical protein GCM10010145_57900 [Streptomyces ruber]
MGISTAQRNGSVPWGDVLVSAVAAVSWALIGMAGTAALGLHLLGADTVAALGPLTAAVVALAAGGSVTPSGDVSAFGLEGARATTAVQITPLGVGLVGALLLSWFFLRSLRGAGAVIRPAELLARAGTVVALFAALMGGLAWAGHSAVTIDGGDLAPGGPPGGGGAGGGGSGVPGPGGLGDFGGLLPDRLGDLADVRAKVGFTVDTAATPTGGLVWCAGVLLIALLASRRTPLPSGWAVVHRVVRPAASALVTVLLAAVLAGLAAAAYAAAGDDRPQRIAGAALLGAPNGVWLGVPLGLLVPWDGIATGGLAQSLPDPLDQLLRVDAGGPVTLGRLAELDGRIWLLGVAAALMMLLAGVLTAARTPFVRGPAAFTPPLVRGRRAAVAGQPAAAEPPQSTPFAFAGRCALRLGVTTALALPLLVLLTEVSVDASLSVFGIDAFDTGIELRGRMGAALLLGALWGAGAGAAGALLACASGAAGRRATVWARGGPGAVGRTGARSGAGAPDTPGAPGARPGPYTPSAPYRPPDPATNPYLRLPGRAREPEDSRPGGGGGRGENRDVDGGREDAGGADDAGIYGAPTVRRFVVPPSRRPGHGSGRGRGSGGARDGRLTPPPPPSPPPPSPPPPSPSRPRPPDDEPPPPPPPPPPAPPRPPSRPPGR